MKEFYRNEKKENVYKLIDYTNETTLYASKLKLEGIISSNINIDEEYLRLYNEAIEEIDNIIKSKISIVNGEIKVSNINGSIIGEGAVYSKDGLTIGVYYDTKRAKSNEAYYFKVYNNTDPRNATKVARITFENQTYITDHKNPNGIKNWKFNRGEYDEFLRVIKSKERGETIWHWLCWDLYKRMGAEIDDKNIPDFSNLK